MSYDSRNTKRRKRKVLAKFRNILRTLEFHEITNAQITNLTLSIINDKRSIMLRCQPVALKRRKVFDFYILKKIGRSWWESTRCHSVTFVCNLILSNFSSIEACLSCSSYTLNIVSTLRCVGKESSNENWWTSILFMQLFANSNITSL